MLRMTDMFRAAMAGILLLASLNAVAFELKSTEFKNGASLKDKHVACKYSKKQKQVVYGKNQSPALRWRKAPKKTQSFVLIVTDPDVPVDRRHVNQPGKVIAKNASRRRVFHWIVTDIPRSVHRLKAGAGSLPAINLDKPVTQLKSSWASTVSYDDIVRFSDSYVGPCPPSNDQRLHHYHFVLYALDVTAVPKGLNQRQLIKFVNAHTIQRAQWVGVRSNNPGAVKL
ncbi:MAG: YbhB/YbcL family Raf kinase inhibitor-like protein [Coxiellaceae bacterium]|nr:YbhB/YbcL family Raf kinase inhibitor-like protein [Coxiellaceae bacterium]